MNFLGNFYYNVPVVNCCIRFNNSTYSCPKSDVSYFITKRFQIAVCLDWLGSIEGKVHFRTRSCSVASDHPKSKKNRFFRETRYRLMKAAMQRPLEQKIDIKFCVKLNESIVESLLMIKTAFGDDCLSELQFQRCHKSDETCAGRPSTTITDKIVTHVYENI